MPIPASNSSPAVHPLLAMLPAGLWVFSLACDLLYLGGGEAEIWSRLALYSMVGGFAGVLGTMAVPGFIAHLNVTLIVVCLYAVNLWLRLGEPFLAPAIVLSVIGVGMLAASSRLESALLRFRGDR